MSLKPITLGPRPKALTRPQDLVPRSAEAPPRWWNITNADDSDTARVDIMDMIDSWGWFGISAVDFVGELNAITKPNIALHINSPGGDVFDGVAIMNAVIQHPARVTAYVDGLAASIASVICMGADEVVMGLGAQMMIHDASGVTIGNAVDMQAAADLLNQVSDNIAGIYAYRAGGSAADWRTVMRGERWYDAEEAVSAGLASRAVVAERADEQPAAEAPRWIAAAWRYAGRDAAPDPISSKICADAADCTHAEPPRTSPDAPAPEAVPATALPTAASNLSEHIRSALLERIRP